jgi:small subunit ribosomal protein S5
MGLITNKKPASELFKSYTSEEKAALANKYTPSQIKAIEAGEAAIDPEDLDSRGVIRTDIGALPYLDDFSHTRGVIDKQPKYEGPLDPSARFMTEDEYGEAWSRKMKELEAKAPAPPPTDNPDDPEYMKKLFPTRMDVARADAEVDMFMGKDGPIPRAMTPSSLAPGLPTNFMADEDTKVKKDKAEEEVDPRDPDGVYNRLIKQTGLTLDEILEYKVKILVKHRVVNQTRLGKIASLYCLAVAGNGNGRLGIGEAKGQEIEETQNNARIAAIRSMQPIPRYEERTIFGEVEGKVSAVEVKLMARPPGESPAAQRMP